MHYRTTAALPLLLTPLALLVSAAAAPARQAATVPKPSPDDVTFFEAKVRPLLIEKCYGCHSASSAVLKGGLRLDTPSGALAGGAHGPAVVPGKPDESLLVRAIRYTDASLRMPPTGKLADSEIGVLTDWVRRGAMFPASQAHPASLIPHPSTFWAYQPLRRVSPPTGGPAARWAWCRTPVDRFVLAKLREKGLTPNPPADRRTLIRRAYFDLIGLPPTPEQVEAFVNDRSPLTTAWEKVVDGLLASPHYGERWGRHWLDLARFAESHGYEQDYDRPYAYHYRDFVIQALNRDLPYDTFVRWQLAGDEIAPDNPMALEATGFLAAGTHATQITKNQVEKERYDELDDMLNTTCVSLLGTTVGCARCHDHKYDPIPTREYYRMLSTFTTTVRSDYPVDMDPEGDRRAKAAFDREHAPLEAALRTYERDALPAELRDWLAGPGSAAPRAAWVLPQVTSAFSAGGATLTEQPDGSYLASGKSADNDRYTFTVRTDLRGITAARLEALADPSLVKGGPGRADNGNFALTDFRVTAAPAAAPQKPADLKLAGARATFEQKGLPVAAAIDADPKSGWAVDPQFGRSHAAVFALAQPAGFDRGTILTFTLRFDNNTRHSIGRVRLSVTTQPGAVAFDALTRPEPVETVLAAHRAPTSGEMPALLAWYRTQDPEWQRLNRRVQDDLARAPKPHIETVLISSEGVPAVRTNTQGGDFLEHTWFLKRGDPNQKGDVVTQSFLSVLTRAPEGARHWQQAPPKGWRTSYQRRALASWITDVDEGAGPLLARVIVNRVWQHHMGRGIVGTPSDFGAQGDRPSDPELLDWLARAFVKDEGGRMKDEGHGAHPSSLILHPSSFELGWSLKKLHRLIMTSAVYMQSAAGDAVKEQADPENKLCWRHPRQRLEAEAIRDSLLSVSGLLDPTMYGPGTLDETMRRRSIYFFVKRSKLIPSLMVFDAPNALQPIGLRAATTVAPQALLLMNSPQVRAYAKAFAARVAPRPNTVAADAVKRAYLLALSRPPTARELADSTAFIAQQTASYRAAGQKDADARALALADFCQAVMSLNEFVYVD